MLIKIKQLSLVAGDIVTLYLSLLITLIFRYGLIFSRYIHDHLGPFSIVFVCWIIIFYIAGLYDVKNLKNTLSFLRQFMIAIFAGTITAISMFYAVKYFSISPKTNLAIFVIIFFFIGAIWRFSFNTFIKTPQRATLIIGDDPELQELATFITHNPQAGYHITAHLTIHDASHQDITTIIEKNNIDTIIIQQHAPLTSSAHIYERIAQRVDVMDSIEAYELFFKKLPLAQIETSWIMTHLSRHSSAYEIIKRPIEGFLALILTIILSPLLILIYLLVILTSRGGGIYKQLRVGKQEKTFFIYKFRTMIANAETSGAQWAQHKDPRITPLGTFLRFSHIDELPQLINVIRGDLSFIGPRPERPEFVKELSEKIPYYTLRHIIKPGITGWAQINYRYGSSVQDAYAKLQYDMYYVKERSFIFDVLTILKTIKMFLFNYA